MVRNNEAIVEDCSDEESFLLDRSQHSFSSRSNGMLHIVESDAQVKATPLWKSFLKALFVIGLFMVVINVPSYLLRGDKFVFKQAEIEQLAARFKGSSMVSGFLPLVRELQEDNNLHLIPESTRRNCHFASVDGLKGKVCLLHGSLFEMLLVWETEIPTSGWFGSHLMNSSVYVIDGSVQVWGDEIFSQVGPGGKFASELADNALVKFGGSSWGIMYSQGVIPVSGIKLVLGTITQGNNWMSCFNIISLYLQSFCMECWSFLGQYIVEFSKATQNITA